MKGKPEQRPRPRRISEKYRKRFSAIAAILVRCGGNKAAAARLVQSELPDLKSFRAGRFDSWEGNPEWEDAIRSAQMQISASREMPPELRGAKLLRFAQGALKSIDEDYEAEKLDGGDNKKALADLEKRLLAIHDAVRSEERHQDNLKAQAALRSAKNIIANLVAVARTCDSITSYLARLADFARDPAKLLGVTIE